MTRVDRPNVKLFVRLDPEVGLESRKERVVERLTSLEGREAIADYDIFTWSRGIRLDGPLEESSYCRTLLEHVGELRAWIDENCVDSCGFDVQAVRSTVTGESYDVVSLPAICLAVYDGDELVDLYPRRTSETVENVDDGLASLERQPIQIDG